MAVRLLEKGRRMGLTMKPWTILSAVIVLFFAHACTCKDPAAGGGDQKDFNALVLEENRMMQYFTANHTGIAVLKYAQADLDNDGKDDLVVIYQIAKEQNQMCIIRHQGGKFVETNAVPAPVSDQLILFRNIDGKPPLEFIVQGRKGAKAGYAIFRIEEGKLTDLFGEGMDDCC
jgi:hypothetical protein